MNTIISFRILILAVITTLMLALNIACAGSIDNSRFQTPFRSLEGKLMYVGIFSYDETSRINKAGGSEGAEGDIIYSGHYSFVVGKIAGKFVREEKHISPLAEDILSFNASRTLFYVGEHPFPDQPDILWILQSGTSNNLPIRGYYMKEEKMRLIRWRTDPTSVETYWSVKIGYRPVAIKPGCYATSVYDNSKGGFIHREWQLDTTTDSFILYNTYFVPYDQEPRSGNP